MVKHKTIMQNRYFRTKFCFVRSWIKRGWLKKVEKKEVGKRKVGTKGKVGAKTSVLFFSRQQYKSVLCLVGRNFDHQPKF